MVRKFVRKLMLVMTALVILLLIIMQASNLALTYFHSSSLPVQLPLTSNLDYFHGVFYICIKKKNIKICLKDKKKQLYDHALCITRSYRNCLFNKVEHKDDPLYKKIRRPLKVMKTALKTTKVSFIVEIVYMNGTYPI